ncbi:MAG: hypothetical protein WA126_03145 [Thermodesulfovibrionales bacterium]
MVIAARIPAHNYIQSYYDFNISNAFEDSKKIILLPLPARSILEARIRTFLKEGRTLRNLIKSGLISKITDLVQKIINFLKNVDEKVDILFPDYPFNSIQHDFIREMSNGNIRYMLKYAQELLIYMSSEQYKEKVDLRECLTKLITNFASLNTDEKIRVYNLNEKKTFQYISKKVLREKKIPSNMINNSKYILLLETYKRFSPPYHIDNSYLNNLEQSYGLQQSEIPHLNNDMVSMELMRERALFGRIALGRKLPPSPDYDLTSRGYYYLACLIHEKRYINIFGRSQHHIDGRTYKLMECIETALLEFLVNIYLVRKEINGIQSKRDFKINKTQFTEYFQETYTLLLFHWEEYDSIVTKKLSCNDISIYLAHRLKIIETDELEYQRNYLFLQSKIIERCKERSMPIEIKHLCDVENFKRFVKKHVLIPEYEKK